MAQIAAQCQATSCSSRAASSSSETFNSCAISTRESTGGILRAGSGGEGFEYCSNGRNGSIVRKTAPIIQNASTKASIAACCCTIP